MNNIPSYSARNGINYNEIISNPIDLAKKIKEGQGRIFVDPIISETVVKIKGVEHVKCVDINKISSVQSTGGMSGAIAMGFIPDVASFISSLISSDTTALEAILREIIKGAAAGFGGYMIKIGLDSLKARIEDHNMKKAIRENYEVKVFLDKDRIVQCEMCLKNR